MYIGPLLGYLFFAIFPLSLFLQRGGVSIAGLLPYELVLVLTVCYSIIIVASKAKHINLILLDLLAIALVFFSLIPVALSVENLYVAARDYRQLYLVPLITYLSLPLLFNDMRQLSFAYLIIIPGLFLVGASLLPDFLNTGGRPQGNLSTVGVLASWSTAISFSIRNIFFTKYKSVVYLTAFLMILIIAIASSRAIIFALLISWLITFFIFKKSIYQKLFIFSFIGLLMLFFLSLVFVSEDSLRPKTHLSNEYKEMRRSVRRLVSVEYYIDDIKDRMSLWKQVFHIGLESPIFGTGAISYRSFRTINRHTPHSIFLSSFLTSGFVGLCIFITLIIVSYTTIFSFAGFEHLRLISKFFFIALTVLLISGATNDFSGGRSLLFFILLSGIATTKKLLIAND